MQGQRVSGSHDLTQASPGGRNHASCVVDRHAIERDPTYNRAYLRAGVACMALKQPADALHMYQQALEIDSRNTAAQVHGHKTVT